MKDIWDIALGFMDSQVLLTAEGLGVFTCLDAGPRTAPEVAGATGLPDDSAARLLTALCAMELVRRQSDGRYVSSPEAADKLVRGSPGYVGAMFDHLRDDLYPVWGHFRHALMEGRAQWDRAFPGAPPGERVHSDPQALRRFLEGMHAITHNAAWELAQVAPEVREIESIVDVGGATGAFVIALAHANPALRGVVYDLPAVQPIAEDFLRGSGLNGRASFHAGDFWSEELPAGFDAYSLGFVLHDWDDAGQSILLRKVARAARPGAMLIIGEYLLHEDRTGPPWVARSDLNMLTAARGRERTASEYAEWISRFGFELSRTYLTAHPKQFLIARRVPLDGDPTPRFNQPAATRAAGAATDR